MCSPEPKDPPTVTCKIPKKEDIKPPSLPWKDAPIPTEVVLLTVKYPEFLGCYAFLRNIKKSHRDGLGWVYFGELVGADDNPQKVHVTLVQCFQGSTNPGGPSTTVQKAVRILKPKAVMCVGYCGGLNLRKVKLGDVVLSAKLAIYSNSKITSSGVEVRATITNVSRRMKTLIMSAGLGWEAPIVNNETDQLKKPEVYPMAEIASGPELVNADERREELLRLFPAAIAIEMEGEGVYASCHDLGVEWAVIKGVSDYAGDTRSETENWKPFASVMAASIVNHIFSDPVVLNSWPHYSETASTTNQDVPVMSSSEVDSGKPYSKPQPTEGCKRFSCKLNSLPPDTYKRICQLLDKKRTFGDYRSLAEVLLYTQGDVELLELGEPTENLLGDWQFKKGNNVFTLMKGLQKIERHDVWEKLESVCPCNCPACLEMENDWDKKQ